jgi:two-component system, NarL family, invasion response regulator UvrY
MRVLIVDDHPIFLAGVKETLAREEDVKLVGEASNGHNALELARKRPWDVIVLDITMPEKGGVDVLQELRREQPKLPILILSTHPEDQMALRLLRLGASGYLTKDKAPDVLLTAVRKIVGGGKYISESLAEKVVVGLGAEKVLHETLSNREYEVMRMIALGKSMRDIGKDLFISVRTVSTYRARILAKLQIKTNTDLIRYALQNKLIE